MLFDRYISRCVCFESEVEGQEVNLENLAGTETGEGVDTNTNQSTGTDDNERLFTQDQVNKFLANDRRKNQEKLQNVEKRLQDLLAQKNLQTDERTKLEGELDDLQKVLRTKEQQAEYERKTLESKLKTELEGHKDTAQQWENRYKSSMLNGSLREAAVKGGAFNPDHIISILMPHTKIVEATDDNGDTTGEYTTVVDFPDIDEKTKQPITTRRTPEEAVKRMRELPEIHGSLFTANLNGGIGGGTVDGKTGKAIDVNNMSHEDYMKLRKENPQLLYRNR